jgi:outer membrane protein TolC
MPNLNCSGWRGPANPRTTRHGKSRRRGLTARALGTAALLLAFTGAAAAQAPSSPSAGEPLTLKRAIELALRNSHEMALARLQQKVAEKSAMISKADFLPSLYAGSGAAYTNGIPQTPGGSAPSVFDVSYTQQIFNPPLKGQARELQERISAQKFEVEKARDTVILNAASAYLELGKVRHSLELLGKERQSAQRILDVTSERLSEGLELPIEATKAQLSTARIEKRILELEGREDFLETNLRSMTGLPEDQPIQVNTEELPASAEQPVATLVGQALANNASLKEAEAERHGRELRLKGERGGRLPSLQLVGIYSLLTKFNNYGLFYNHFQPHNVNFGVQIQVPLFSAHTIAAISLATTNLKVAEMDLQNQRSELSAEVRRQVHLTRELDAGREVARLELQLAQQNLSVLQAQYQEGRLSLRDLEKARLEESDRWLDFLNAGFERQRAELELLRATGQIAQVFQ